MKPRLAVFTGLLVLSLVPVVFTASRPPEIPFAKHQIDTGASETCAFLDVNGDGRLDLLSGDTWYQAPNWTPHHFRDLNYENGYVDAFSDLPIDVDGDGRTDIVSATWFSKKLSWWRNPGPKGEWRETPIETRFNIEFAFLVDLDNDGQARELLPQFGNTNAPLTWYELSGGRWIPHVIADRSYPHGIGAGDINGDHRADIITPEGWFEAPADPRSGAWKFHPDFKLGSTGFLFVADVNHDGRPDIVTTMAHDYGVLWFEQGENGQWTKHVIDDTWSQAHAMVPIDFGGGRAGWLTGKRYMAHDHDPGAREALGIYWYEPVSGPKGTVQWARHILDYSSRTGAGMQIAVADFDHDGDLDFAVAGKSGLFLFENLTRK